jgi:oligopeptidase A
MKNPFFSVDNTTLFNQVHPSAFESIIDEILDHNRRKIQELTVIEEPTFEKIIPLLEDCDVELQNRWNIISHLHNVQNNEELRSPYEKCLQKITDYQIEIGQNNGLYKKILEIKQHPSFEKAASERKKIINEYLLDFNLSGVHLSSEDKLKFQKNQEILSKLTNQFENNLQDFTDSWSLEVKDKNKLKGIPEKTITQLKEKANEKKIDGWLITLDYPTYYSVISYAEDRELRKELYFAYVTRASELHPGKEKWDNSKIIDAILSHRYTESNILGYESYAHLSLAKKMAKKTNNVIEFLDNLSEKSKKAALNEMENLSDFSKKNLGITHLEPWDLSFVSEKLKQKKFSINDEMLRKYFPEKKVLSGLFKIIKILFDISIVEKNHSNLWNKDVRYFELTDNKGQLVGKLYLDLYARPQKRGGAWMDSAEVRHRFVDHTLQLPAAYVICNFTPADLTHGSLLNHDEVQTLFHEFGHALHHLLTQQNINSISGLHGVPWDGVEFPSQFMENFCWHKETLELISSHIDTNEPLPEEVLKNLLAARNFNSAISMLRQIELSLFDFKIHLEYSADIPNFVQHLLDDIRKKVSVTPTAPFNRFQHSFTHIFSGGYAAGYYSYKWAEVLSADAFLRFKQEGILNPKLGREYLEKILAKGGSEDYLKLFVDFMGREPDVKALLIQEGILESL